jgi:pimeloyl-ACP methyl ester carboxylesterase
LVRGSVSKELSSIDVPVFLGTGEFDITGFPHAIPRQFPGSQDVTVFVLPNAGHNHNVAESRVVLWDRIAAWAESLAAVSSGELRAPTVGARHRATTAAADHDV